MAFIFWSFLFGYWENEEEGSIFLVWNLVENEATGDLKLWVLAVQEKKGKRKKEKNFKLWVNAVCLECQVGQMSKF